MRIASIAGIAVLACVLLGTSGVWLFACGLHQPASLAYVGSPADRAVASSMPADADLPASTRVGGDREAGSKFVNGEYRSERCRIPTPLPEGYPPPTPPGGARRAGFPQRAGRSNGQIIRRSIHMVERCGAVRVTGIAAGLIALAAGVSGCGLTGGDVAPLETVQQVDIARYTGKWYEIAKYPVIFERGCAGVTAEYTLREDGTVGVLNTCRGSDGTTVNNTINGFATVADPSTNAKLTVYFFYPFGAPYWIIELDENYQYAVVGDPSRSFLWILSRTPTLDESVYSQIIERLPARGYDPAKLEKTPQFPELGY